MDQYYCPKIKYLLFLLFLFIGLTKVFSQSFTETYYDGSDYVISLSKTHHEVQFDFEFTADGGRGDFVHNEGSGNLNILSMDIDDNTIERVTIR
tara:strand:+ start:158 stop:439 length:282 start_codon:yes stop_codon:yes gene_type:complete